MTYTLTLNLNEEQKDALDAVVAAVNAQSGVTRTSTEHLADAALAVVNGYVAQAYEAAVHRLGETARALPYAEHKALIQQVEEQVSP